MVLAIGDTLSTKIMWSQWLGGICVTLLTIEVGLLGGWSSPYLAKLTVEDSPIPLSPEEASWVASLMNLGRLAGAVLGSVGVEFIGSKTTMLVTCVPVSLCWILTIIADSVSWLYAARLSGGIGLGMAFSSFPLYLGEIADPSIRGALVSMAICGTPAGNVIASLTGANLPMTISSEINLIPCIVLIALLFWIPESPHHLVLKNDMEEAKKSIRWYHGDGDAEAELTSLAKFVSASQSQTCSQKIKEMTQPHIRKAMILIVVLFMFMQMCGLNSVIFYMEIILKRGQAQIMAPSTVVNIVGMFGVLASALSIYLIEKCGRRFLLIASCAGVAASLAALGMHFLFLDQGVDSELLDWLPVVSLIVFEFAVFAGLMPVPSTVLSELFPANVKSTAACFGSASSAIFAFVSSKTYQPMVDALGEHYVFWIYGGIVILAIPYALIYMPETKGKSLQQIQEDLAKT
ncbi:facilitated trehalose transporter Tret1 [Orussus abietinus]|uniref:facilitated trehalose transporter Tret1 n=1 Tax=Orussus abietinus TaxID=222816 RepID=UPI0006262F2C|nr:facilitated trehalose transporter Tret1 [Orussus abietinus]